RSACTRGWRRSSSRRLRDPKVCAHEHEPWRSCSCAHGGFGLKPRVLFVGRTRYSLPLAGPLARKWDALSERLDVRVLASGTGSDPRFRLVPPRSLDGPRFYAELPARVARELRAFDPDVVI